MDKIAEYYVEINDSQLKKLDATMDATGRKFISQTDKMSQGLKAVGVLFATIGVAKFGSDIFQASLKMENLNKMILANEGNQKKATVALSQYLQMAKSPALSLPQVAQGMTQLKNLGVSASQAEKTIMALGNQMALSGKGAEEFGHVMLQIQQSLGKTSIMAQDLNVIAESLPSMRKTIKEALGTADTEAIAKLGYTTAQVWEKIVAVWEKAPKAIEGTQNALDNFADSLMQFKSAVGTTFMPTISDMLNGLTKLMDKMNAMPSVSRMSTEQAAEWLVNKGSEPLVSALEKQMQNKDYKQEEPINTETYRAFRKAGVDIHPLANAYDLYQRLRPTLTPEYIEKPLNLTDTSKPMTMTEWEKTYKETQFPMPTYDLSKKRENQPFSTFDTYAGGFSGMMANFKPSRNVMPSASRADILLANMFSTQMYNEPGGQLNEATGMTQKQETAYRDQEKIKKAMQETAEEQKEIDRNHSGIMAKQQKIIDGWSTGIDKFGDDWDKMWDETQNGIDKVDKKQKTFWSSISSGGKDFAYNVMDVSVNQAFDNFFKKTQTAIDAWNEFGYKSGKTWDNFSQNWEDSLEQQKFVWHDFLKDMLIEFGKMLAKKLIMYAAEKGAELIIDKVTGGPGGQATDDGWYSKGSIVDDIIPGEKEAFGGSGIVNKPTLFLAGEAGPEHFRFTPLSKARQGNSPITVNVYPQGNTDIVSFKRMTERAIKDMVNDGTLNRVVL